MVAPHMERTADLREAEDTQPRNVYAVLQLRSTASRTLIEQVYWRLAENAQHRTDAASAMQLHALNQAYATLTDGQRREAYDAAHGFVNGAARKKTRGGGVGRFFVRKDGTPRAGRSGAYDVLHVTADASQEVVDLAYLVNRVAIKDAKLEQTEALPVLERAYALVSNAERRAAYDAGMRAPVFAAPSAPARPPVVVQAPVAAAPAVAAPAPAVSPPAVAAVVAEVIEPIAPPTVPVEPTPLPTFLRPTPAPVPVYVPDTVPVFLSREAAHEPEVEAVTATSEPVVDLPLEPASAEPTREVAPAPVAAGPAYVTPSALLAAAVTAATPAPREGLFARLRGRGQSEEQVSAMNAAQRSRLLSLRETVAFAPAASATPAADRDLAPSEVRAAAYLTFVGGARGGLRIPLDGQAVILGTSMRASIMLPDDDGSIALEHARIWRQADSFYFRNVDGKGTTIAGRQLDLPVVVLEDGDEIAIGPHRLSFSRA